MAVNSVFWWGGEGYDIHVVAGTTSRTLNDLLGISHGSPAVNVRANAPPAGVTVRFRAAFNGVMSLGTFKGFGVAVHPGTGEVTVVNPLPAGHRLRNFLIHAEVTDTTVNPAKTFVKKIRVHVHGAVVRVWLTPEVLNVRRGANGLRFSVLAEFDDETVGDLSRLPGLGWSSSPSANVGVNAATGQLTANVDASRSDVTVTLPAAYGGGTDTAVAQSLAPWSTPGTARVLPGGPGAARIGEVMNFLFLPEGFTFGEQAIFERAVQHFVTFLRRSPAARPYDLCSGEVNYWMAWIESQERGTSPLYELNPVTRGGRMFGQEIEPAVAPDPAMPFWGLPEAIHEVGLPVRAHVGVAFAAQQAEWTAVYGAVAAGNIDVHLHADWAAIAERGVVHERDTALGLALGERPQGEMVATPRSLSWHPFRTTRAHLDQFLANLRNATAPGGPAIGAVWGPGGKDRRFVIAICAGARMGGAQTGAPQELIATTFVEDEEVELAAIAGTRGLTTVPYAVPASASLDAKCTVAHEAAHALGLGDEYGELPAITPGSAAVVNLFLNIQDAASASVPSPGAGLDPNRLKWKWPRIAKAGVLAMAPQAVGGDFRLILRRGHAAQFAVGDVVRLRTRPLRAGIVPSIELEVTGVAGDELVVHPPGLPPFVPLIFVAGSIVYVQREGRVQPPAVRGTPLELISPTVLAHMTASGIPLNAATGPPAAHVCTPDFNEIQAVGNRPAALPRGRPRYNAWILGAFEGGHSFACGVLHPTGACMMRQLEVPPANAIRAFGRRNVAYRFCPVCRYVLVDRLDPSQHGAIDRDYDAQYAEPP